VVFISNGRPTTTSSNVSVWTNLPMSASRSVLSISLDEGHQQFSNVPQYDLIPFSCNETPPLPPLSSESSRKSWTRLVWKHAKRRFACSSSPKDYEFDSDSESIYSRTTNSTIHRSSRDPPVLPEISKSEPIRNSFIGRIMSASSQQDLDKACHGMLPTVPENMSPKLKKRREHLLREATELAWSRCKNMRSNFVEDVNKFEVKRNKFVQDIQRELSLKSRNQ